MKNSLFIILAVVTMFMVSSCDQNLARNWGGKATVNVPPGEKVIGAGWKGNQIWYTTRPMKEGERAETVIMRESSQFELMQGAVYFKESDKIIYDN